ncbi:hypothetical protein D3218_07465 [Aureimonas flava]|uniref:Uncharacterized protein n=1 Tax=Aureimonas flava TaxID=2320271 RepID=A0A3A1WNG7_9HYPH|nr:hypothetical protein [Aureimonas flava]RIY02124.1 hypothetical protein D3218_07465 [Aureimonas flava]
MKSLLTTVLVLAGSLGAASGAMAATHAVRQPVPHPVEHARAAPTKVMSEKPNADPGLTGVFQASDGVIYAPTVNDPRIHGLPEY